MFFKERDKKFKTWHLVVIAIVIVFAVFFHWYYDRNQTGLITLAGRTYPVMVARTPAQQYRGLSNRESLGLYSGMVFPFMNKDRYALVMRQMRFSLDIIWLDDGTIVDIAPNLAPDPATNESDLVQYLPRAPANMVLEVPAGFAAKHNLKVGDTVTYKVAY